MRKWYPATVVAVVILISLFAYPHLPERVPTHWNVRGEVNGWGSREFAAFLMPVMMLGMWGIMRALPKIDPRRQNYAKFQGAYDLMIAAVLTTVAIVHVAVLASAMGYPVSIDRLMPGVIGLMLVVVGNQLPRARPNWWFGIRTPWTLSNDRVWERTHRVGGFLVMCAGAALVLAAAFFPKPAPIIVVVIVLAMLGSVGYSYYAWRQETSR